MNANDIDKLAMTLTKRWWCQVMLPGLGLQLLMVALIAGAVTSNAHTLAQEPATTVQRPDEGQPPSPVADTPVAERPSVQNTTPDPVAERPSVQSTTPDPTPKEPPQPVAPQAAAPQAAAPQAAAPQAEVTTQAELEVHELATTPAEERQPMLPQDRPSWVFAEPDVTTSQRHRVFVGSEPMSSQAEAESAAALDEALVTAVNDYFNDYLNVSPRIGITAEQIRQDLVDPLTSYMMPLTTSQGPQYQKWVVLNISKEKQEEYKRRDAQLQQRDRMAVLGVGLALLLGLTGIVNRAFTRRQSRYPSLGLPPTTMPLLSAMAGNGHNHVHLVGAELPIIQAPRRRSRCGRFFRGAILAVSLCIVIGLVTQAIVIRSGIERSEAIQVHFSHEPLEVHEQPGAFMHFGEELNEVNKEIRDTLRQEIRETLGHN